MTVGESTLDNLLTTASIEVEPSTKCGLVISDTCKHVVTSPTIAGEVPLLTMSMSLGMLSLAIALDDLSTRLAAS